VYARVQSNNCDMSFTSSAIRTTAWSMLSGLSLNDISIISVLALPISLEEVESIGRQLTFARIISGAQEPGSPNGQDSQLPSSSVLREVLLPPIAEDTSKRWRRMDETTLTRLASVHLGYATTASRPRASSRRQATLRRQTDTL
jgi:hypothetical protein